MESLVDYPGMGAAVLAAKNIVQVIREQSYGPNKELLGESVWNLQGYLQSVIIGTTELPSGGAVPNEFVMLKDELGTVFSPRAEAAAVPVWLITILKILKEILEGYFDL